MPERLNSSRDVQVTGLRKAGLTYAEIGRKLGLTRERVRQIAKADTTVKKKPARYNPNALLTTAEAAALLNVHVNTVRRWSNKGILETYRIGSRGDRRLRRRDVDKLLRNSRQAQAVAISGMEEEALRAKGKHKGVIVDVSELPPTGAGEVVIPIGSVDKLVRTADALLKPVLHHAEADKHTYCVIDGAIRYQCISQPEDSGS